MGFFNMFKKKETNSVVWRDKQGKIVCPGDSCPKECDESCPIWLNTLGLKMLQINQYENAIKAFEDALVLAPDFVDVQNNIGTAYGMNEQHKEAYHAFKKTIEMKPGYLKALNGLIVSEIKLEMYEDASQHCDELERLGGDSAQFRRDIFEGINGKNKKEEIDYLDLTEELLQHGRESGFIQSEDFAHIPEIMVRAEEVCKKIIVGIQNYAVENPGEISNTPDLSLAWACYAGIGAVHHWNIDWNELSAKGIYETLTEERGLFEMDEYVMDAIGFGFGSEKEHELTSFVRQQAMMCMLKIVECGPAMENFIACAKAMYLFGMTYEMNQLGML